MARSGGNSKRVEAIEEGQATKSGVLAMAEDPEGKATPIKTGGLKGESIKVTGEQSHVLKEQLVEQKITNKHLSLLTDAEFQEVEIEE